jgi:MYXO-CTERM domain-containing protein
MKRTNRLPLVLGASLALAMALVVAPAAATPEFPKKIRDTLSLTYDPPCELCHEYGNTGIGSLRTPFGLTIRSYAVSGDDPQTLVTTLGQMKTDRIDSDGDGKLDVDELTGNPTATPPVPPSNPNARAPGDTPWPTSTIPAAGCATSSSAGGADVPAWIAAGLVAGVFALRARRK